MHQPTALSKYTHLLFDEVHERSMDSDMLLLVVRELMQKGWRGKLVLMSATLDKTLTHYFSDCCSEPYFVGVSRFPVNELCIDEIHTLQMMPKLQWQVSAKLAVQKHTEKIQLCFESLSTRRRNPKAWHK